MMRGRYLSKRRLEELDGSILSERDKAILRSLLNLRYLLTSQVRRLHFAESATPAAGLRATNRTMSKLQGYGIITSLERRIGGVRAGSNSYVWTLTESGANMLHLNDESYTQRKRVYEASLYFVRHTLEVAEVYIQLTEVCKRNQLGITKTELEPSCWRGHTGVDGKPATLKPDMFAVIDSGKYEDSFFIEVDLATESPVVVLDKCKRYAFYCKTGIEQKQYGVFPLVVWLVYNANRKAKLQQYITECREIPEASKGIFIVIMPDEFEALIRHGVSALVKEEGDKCA